MVCRACGAEASRPFCDLGALPLANQLLTQDELAGPETRYPLAPLICDRCQLVQLPELVSPQEIFRADYPYFSSQSAAFVRHARRYAEASIERFALDADSLVVEIASNDGYLLRHFVRAGIRCYGVEPARNVALHAVRRGVATLTEFFDARLVCDELLDCDPETRLTTGGEADLIVANNVLAHVPQLHNFIHGLALLLAPEGVVSIEVPWLASLVEDSEIGTIYHEHYSYFLLRSLERALDGGAATALRVFDVEWLDVHGGSLRVYCCQRDASHGQTARVAELRAIESEWLAGAPLQRFAQRPAQLKRAIWQFISTCREQGRSVAGYCAAAKTSTLLGYCGIGPDDLPYVADTTPAKQGRYLPGCRIPIVPEEQLLSDRPDVIWILAPNWAPEIVPRLHECCDWDPVIAWQQGTEIIRTGVAHAPVAKAA